MSELLSYLFAILVVAPLQAHVSQHLGPDSKPELMVAGKACIEGAVPQIVAQAEKEWGWAVWTAGGISLGITPPEKLLEGRGPSCDRLVSLLAAPAKSSATDESDV